jgi:AcrR family transcriptional regulator
MPARGPYAKTATRREEILDAALRIISEAGWSGATLLQIADEVGMSKPGLLHHFGSRDALFTAVLQRRDERDLALDDVEPLDGLVTVVRHNAEVPGLVALYSALSGTGATESPGTPARDFLDIRYPEVVERFADAVRAQQETGAIAAHHDPEQLARLLIASADGLQTQWLLDPRVDMAAHLETLLALYAPHP